MQVCHHPAFEGSAIRIMPDVHAGQGCVIGFTATFQGDLVVPNLIGVDIGCGVLSARLDSRQEVDKDYLSEIDRRMRYEIPHGFGVRKSMLPYLTGEFPELLEEVSRISRDILKDGKENYHFRSIGSLGGGNHFVEISRNEVDGAHYLHVHSGSRNFGNCIAEVYQSRAQELCTHDLPVALKYLEGDLSAQYIRDMKVAQEFAKVNRQLMVRELIGEDAVETFDTVHNYISDDNVIRKGAVSAHAGELLLVPLNMRDGSLLCKGKGNSDYNCSAPHGAGRVYSRKKAKALIPMDDYIASMEGIYTTCVTKATLDEAPMAYKDSSVIEEYLLPTADIIARLKPVYNFKAA